MYIILKEVMTSVFNMYYMYYIYYVLYIMYYVLCIMCYYDMCDINVLYYEMFM